MEIDNWGRGIDCSLSDPDGSECGITACLSKDHVQLLMSYRLLDISEAVTWFFTREQFREFAVELEKWSDNL